MNVRDGSSYGAQPFERIPSGVQGFDVALRGGFLKGGIYLILGRPGAGKTILGNQLCFNHVAAGGRAVYVTLLVETHSHMMAHMSSFTFFNPEVIGDSVYYVSGYRVSEQDPLSEMLTFLQRLIQDRRATMLVLDGLDMVEELAVSDLAYREFLHKLHIYAATVGCTTFLLSHVYSANPSHPEHVAVDGIVELQDNHVGLRAVRELEIRKFRGSDYLRGRHNFEITPAGIIVHPRIEAIYTTPPEFAQEQRVRMTFGVQSLDEMLHGGLLSSSTTALFGVGGSGKTILGLHFLAAGASEGQQGLYFGFYEPPPRLISKADGIGLNFRKHVEQGTIEVLWQPPLEGVLDRLAERMLDAVQRKRVKRLFIDGINAFELAADYPVRIGSFFSALGNELRALDVTTLLSIELTDLFGPSVKLPFHGISATIENIIFLRYVELRSQLYRLISILKMRESAYDSTIREFKISSGGIEVASTFESAEAILTGLARPIAAVGNLTLYGEGTQEP